MNERGMVRGVLFFGLIFGAMTARAGLNPTWAEGVPVFPGGQPNPFGLDDSTVRDAVEKGRGHALQYPVTATEILIPYWPIDRLLKNPTNFPMKAIFLATIQWAGNIGSADALFSWLGMPPYPQETDTGVYKAPFPGGRRPTHPMGASIVHREGAEGFTISCAACHSGSLFGKRVLGMTTRFPRSNQFFHQAQRLTETVPGYLFQIGLLTNFAEKRLYDRARAALHYVGSRKPLVLGLDTSLAHTALSLAKRTADDVATKDPRYADDPDPEPLATTPADSKPSVWWNLKYKNRWLSDGSLISGNPIYTNFIWNELGRGVDLPTLETWLDKNSIVVRDLTTAVFSSEAPKYSDFFSRTAFDIDAAKRGKILFDQSCARCHGTYRKVWELPEAPQLPIVQLMQTLEVRYPEQTPVVDVGTDPHRHQGMRSLAKRLNPLAISQKKGIRIVPQEGYVPPPLVGIWARWPYFHNNSAPSLCAVLTRSADRPKVYYAGEAENPATDFDMDCNGYPLGERTPAAWVSDSEKRFDTSVPGLSNAGHDEGIFLSGGKESFTPDQKRDLVRFLQSL